VPGTTAPAGLPAVPPPGPASLQQRAIDSELARKASEERYRQLFEGMRDGFALHEIICDDAGRPVDYRFLSVNLAFERLTGLRAANVVGRTVLEIMPATEADFIERYGRVALTGEGVEFEQYSGVLQRHYEIAAFSPRPGQFATVFIDLTEKKRMEAALRDSEERYRRITAAITDYIYTVRVAGGRAVETVHSPGCLSITGYDPGEFAAAPLLWIDMVLAADRPAVEEQARRILAGEEAGPVEHRLVHKNGSVRWVSNTVVPHRDEHGALVAYDGLIHDITTRKLAELALRESEEKFAKAFRRAPVWMLITDTAEGRILDVNESALLAAGATRDEVIGRTAVQMGWLDADANAGLREALLARGRIANLEMDLQAKDGQARWVRLNCEQIMIGGRPCFLTVGVDITERQRAKAALAESNFFLRKAHEIARLGSYRLDLTQDRWTSTPQLDEIFGIDRNYQRDLAGWVNLVAPTHREEMIAYVRDQVIGGRNRFDRKYPIIRPSDGQRRWVYGTGEIEYDARDQPRLLIGSIQDITSTQAAEAALIESERNLHEAQLLAGLGSWRVDFGAEGERWSASPELRRIYGHAGDQPLAANSWFEAIHPEDRPWIEQVWSAFTRGEAPGTASTASSWTGEPNGSASARGSGSIPPRAGHWRSPAPARTSPSASWRRSPMPGWRRPWPRRPRRS
jgi:PAS domain S-box-containing protein